MADTVNIATKARISLAQEGDEHAFEQLYEGYYDRILNYAFRRVLDRDVAEDISANVFMAVAKNIGNFTYYHENSFNGWIFRIASNEVNQYFRKANKYKTVDIRDYEQILPDDRESVESELSKKQDYMRIHKHIMQLKPKQQTIIDLFYFEGLSHRAIAEAVDMNEGAVRVTLHRALNSISNKVDKDNLKEVGI